MAKKKKEVEERKGTIHLSRLVEHRAVIRIIGRTPLIIHKWSEKAKKMMPGHPEKSSVKVKKEVRQPKEEAEACLYRLGKTIGMPATAFKAALVGACRLFEAPTMVEAKQLLFVEGEGPEQLVEIHFKNKELREDTPRISQGKADLRYRYYLMDWWAELAVRFIPDLISLESVISIADAAGRGGVGDWRPSSPKSCTGTYGTWGVDDKTEVHDEEI